MALPWNAEMIRWPELFAFGVIDIVLLKVPAASYGCDAGINIAGL